MSKLKRQAKKKTRQAKREVRKANRRENNPLTVVRKAVERRGARKDAESQSQMRINEQDAAAARTVSSMQNTDVNEERSILSEVEAAEEQAQNTGINGGNLAIQQIRKTQNYLQRRKRKPEQDPEMLAAQLYEERQRHIEEMNARQRSEIQKQYTRPTGTMGAPEDYPEYEQDEIPEDEFPDYEDTHEDLLEEEESQFSFDGDEDNFLDPDTLGVVLGVGKSAADKYRENRFAKGQKAFGKTKKQWEAEQAKKEAIAAGKEPDPSILRAAQNEAEKLIKKQTVEDNTNLIWIAGISFVLVLAGVYYYGKKQG